MDEKYAKLEYEYNILLYKYEGGLQAQKDFLIDNLSLEIQGLQDIANLCDERVAMKINRRIANMQKILQNNFKQY